MTTYEHVMLGVYGTLATGLHERHGWKIVAMAGIAAAAPDVDGLTWLASKAAFSEGHRVWGHNIGACLLLGLIIGIADYQLDLVTRLARRLKRWLRLAIPSSVLALREHPDLRSRQAIWIVVAIVAAFSQLPADLVVSGTKTLPVWGLKILWPFSDREWSWRLVSYNDPGVILIFIVGMFAMVKWPKRLRLISGLSLAFAFAYLLVRGLVWPETVFGM